MPRVLSLFVLLLTIFAVHAEDSPEAGIPGEIKRDGAWVHAVMIKEDNARVFVRFENDGKMYEGWIAKQSWRTSQSATAPANPQAPGTSIESSNIGKPAGTSSEGLVKVGTVWLPATMLKQDEKRIFVRYNNGGKTREEWVPRESFGFLGTPPPDEPHSTGSGQAPATGSGQGSENAADKSAPKPPDNEKRNVEAPPSAPSDAKLVAGEARLNGTWTKAFLVKEEKKKVLIRRDSDGQTIEEWIARANWRKLKTTDN